MKPIASLKQRLLALPDVRTGRELEAKYSVFVQRTKTSRERVERALQVARVATECVAEFDFAESLKRARRAASAAARLQATLADDPRGVGLNSVERSFMIMNDHADAAWKSCQDTWQREIDGKIRDWTPLVEVVNKLDPDQGSRLRSTIVALQSIKSKPPAAEVEARKAKSHLNDLGAIIGKFRLETVFGKFLRSVASPEGASFSDAQSPEVIAAIAEYKLGQVFRVKLS